MLRRLGAAVSQRIVGAVGLRPFTRDLYHVFIDGWGASFQDVDRTLRQIRQLGDAPWAQAWERTAERYLDLARNLDAQGRHGSAAALYKRASLLFRIGDIAISADTPIKRALYARCADAYAHYADLSEPRIERLQVGGIGSPLAGYLHRPRRPGNAPCVVIVPGLASAKEQPDFQPEAFVARDIAAFTMDLPGHGEAFTGSRLHFASYHTISDAIDILSRQPGIDPARVAVLGTSLGGTVALKAASEDARIAAVVSISGFYEPRHWFEASARFVEAALKHATGIDGSLEVREMVQQFTLRGSIAHITCPMLVLHGDGDIIIPVNEARQIYAEATGQRMLVVYPGGDHGLLNSPGATYDVLDWIVRQLSAERVDRLSTIAG
ncbi:MAG TPA: alpha/beta fold hydrolase [Chloroflexota bacterium]